MATRKYHTVTQPDGQQVSLCAPDLAAQLGIKHKTAHTRLQKYIAGKIGYDALMAPLNTQLFRSKGRQEAEPYFHDDKGIRWTLSDLVYDVYGLGKKTARTRIENYNAGRITLAEVFKQARSEEPKRKMTYHKACHISIGNGVVFTEAARV